MINILKISFVAFLLASLHANDESKIKCNSMFGRTANGDGTNTYSFSCRCTADSNKSTVQTYCDYRGSEIKSNCSGNPLKSPDNELSLQIANCTNGMALVSLKFKDGSSKTANFPLYCIGVGTAGLDCNGSATV